MFKSFILLPHLYDVVHTVLRGCNGCRYKVGMTKVERVFLTLFLFCSISCSKTTLNSVFERKYGKEVKKINVSRTPPKEALGKNAKLNFSLPIPESGQSLSDGDEADYNQHYANVDVEEYISVPPKEFLPNAANFEQAKLAPESLPKNMFDINYYTALSPPFKRSGIDFDLINIPKQDYYGIVTAMTTKDYLLIGSDSLQKNVDRINNSRSEKDIEMSKILIKEQRQIRRDHRMIKVFGREAKLDSSDTKSDKK